MSHRPMQWIEYVELQNVAIITAVDCPTCKRKAGQDCRTSGGNISWTAHVTRREAWRAHLVEKYGMIEL